MAVARRLTRQVQTEALPGVRGTSAETSRSTGVGLEQARAQKFGTIAGVTSRIASETAGVLSVVIQEERQKASETALLKASNQLEAWKRKRLYDPQSGAMTLKGEAAQVLPEQIANEFDTVAGDIAASLGTDEQRLAFERVRSQTFASTDLEVRRHVFGEMQQFRADELKAARINGVDAAIRSAADPQLVAEQLGKLETQLRTNLPRLGVGPQGVEEEIGAVRSEVHSGVIRQLIAQGKDREAKIYFEDKDIKKQINAAEQTKLLEVVKRSTTDAEGERVAAGIWKTMGPATDTDPISLDQMESQARAQLGDDTDTLKATIAALRTRKQGVDDGRRERLNQRDTVLWGAVLQGQDYDAIRRMPEAVANPEELQTVRDYLQRQVEHRENLANAREGRAAARESRAYTAEARAQNELERKGWASYWEKSQPDVLRAMTPGEIMRDLPTLGSAHVQRLLNDKEKLQKDDATFRTAVIDNDLFREVAGEAGFSYVYKPSKSLTPSQRANLGKLQATVEDEIARKQVTAGRKLTRDETRSVMDDVIGKKVMIRDAGFFYQDVESIAAVVNEKDRAKAFVPIDQVPDSALTDYTNFMKGEPPVSAAERSRRFERAYALKLIGASNAEIQAVLKGGS